MKQIIFLSLLLAQTGVAFADSKNAFDINLGGLIKVDKDGNVEIGAAGQQIKVQDGNVDINSSVGNISVNNGKVDIGVGDAANVNVDGENVDIGAGGAASIKVDGGNVDINAGSSKVQTKDSSSAKRSSSYVPETTKRKLITDDIFIDSKGKRHEVTSKDFSRIKIKNLDLSSYDFVNTDFSWSTLTNISFSGADLSGADFSRTKLHNVDFSGANLTGADLSWATFENINFANATIIGSDIERTSLTNIDFSNGVVRGSCFGWNKFQNVSFVNVDLSDSVFDRYNFENVNFDGTDKGAAVWDADDCDHLKGYAKNVVSGGGYTRKNVQSTVSVSQRAELIDASSIVKTLQKGAGNRIDLTVNFRTDSDQLFGNAHSQVTEIAKALRSETLSDAKVMIEGHTDSEGSDDYNMDLSYRRASTIQRVLTKDFNIPLESLAIKGYGENNPIASNNSSNGRALNRRVTLLRQ